MSDPNEDLVSSLSELTVPYSNTDKLTTMDLPDGFRSRLNDAEVIGLGGASHGTQEFYELRSHLIRLLVKEFEIQAVAFEAPFHQFSQIDERVTAGTGDIRPVLTEMDGRSSVDVSTWLRFVRHSLDRRSY